MNFGEDANIQTTALTHGGINCNLKAGELLSPPCTNPGEILYSIEGHGETCLKGQTRKLEDSLPPVPYAVLRVSQGLQVAWHLIGVCESSIS